jgi:hypothetical protein
VVLLLLLLFLLLLLCLFSFGGEPAAWSRAQDEVVEWLLLEREKERGNGRKQE